MSNSDSKATFRVEEIVPAIPLTVRPFPTVAQDPLDVRYSKSLFVLIDGLPCISREEVKRFCADELPAYLARNGISLTATLWT